jgi:hypothetical protein
MIDATVGTQENCLLLVIEFQSCFPYICGFVRDAATADHEVLLWITVVVQVFVRRHI